MELCILQTSVEDYKMILKVHHDVMQLIVSLLWHISHMSMEATSFIILMKTSFIVDT